MKLVKLSGMGTYLGKKFAMASRRNSSQIMFRIGINILPKILSEWNFSGYFKLLLVTFFLMLCCAGCAMGTDGGEDDIQRVLDREKQLETEEQSKGSSTDGTSYTGNEDEVRETLRRRMEAYIAAHSSSTGPAHRNSNSSEINESYNLTNSTYTAITNLRAKNLEAPNLYGGVSNISDSLGSFKPAGETWGAPPVARQNFGARQNISFNFDPVTMQCRNCNREPHRVLSGVGGTEENPMERMTIA
jgi:hypothetical protein